MYEYNLNRIPWGELTEDDTLAILRRAFHELPSYAREQIFQEFEEIIENG